MPVYDCLSCFRSVPQPLTISVTSAMSRLALTLTRKSRPLWMQTLLINDVKPAQYEAELARLNRLLARSEEREKADKEYIDELYWQSVHVTAQ